MASADTSIYPQSGRRTLYFGALSSDVAPGHQISTATPNQYSTATSDQTSISADPYSTVGANKITCDIKPRAYSDARATGRDKPFASGLERPSQLIRTSEGKENSRRLFHTDAEKDLKTMAEDFFDDLDSYFYREISDAEVVTIADPLLLLERVTGTRHVAQWKCIALAR